MNSRTNIHHKYTCRYGIHQFDHVNISNIRSNTDHRHNHNIRSNDKEIIVRMVTTKIAVMMLSSNKIYHFKYPIC